MTTLYTVRIRRKQLVSIYDKHGNKTEKTTFIEEVQYDMPHEYGTNFRRMYPEAFVEMTPQAREIGRPSEHRIGGRKTSTQPPIDRAKFAGSATKPAARVKSSAKPSTTSTKIDANYGDLVNTMVKNG